MTVYDDIHSRMNKILYNSSSVHVWVTEDGREIQIKDLTDDHLVNILKMLKRKAKAISKTHVLADAPWEDLAKGVFGNALMNPKWAPQFIALENEAKSRNIDWQNIPDGAKVSRTAGMH
jgi:hypothetical protein